MTSLDYMKLSEQTDDVKYGQNPMLGTTYCGAVFVESIFDEVQN